MALVVISILKSGHAGHDHLDSLTNLKFAQLAALCSLYIKLVDAEDLYNLQCPS